MEIPVILSIYTFRSGTPGVKRLGDRHVWAAMVPIPSRPMIDKGRDRGQLFCMAYLEQPAHDQFRDRREGRRATGCDLVA